MQNTRRKKREEKKPYKALGRADSNKVKGSCTGKTWSHMHMLSSTKMARMRVGPLLETKTQGSDRVGRSPSFCSVWRNFLVQLHAGCLSPYSHLITLQACLGLLGYVKPAGCTIEMSSLMSPYRNVVSTLNCLMRRLSTAMMDKMALMESNFTTSEKVFE